MLRAVPGASPPPPAFVSYMVRIGATRSREAMRIPSSAIRPVNSKAQVGSPFAFPWPNTCRAHTHTFFLLAQLNRLP